MCNNEELFKGTISTSENTYTYKDTEDVLWSITEQETFILIKEIDRKSFEETGKEFWINKKIVEFVSITKI